MRLLYAVFVAGYSIGHVDVPPIADMLEGLAHIKKPDKEHGL